ncbi:NADH-quinone oxidoreductase subunit 5 family protein [Spirosoma radiotolerans]|uniref:NADH-quinone oxidoreductase subunit M n=1 Tax=Spirosoma radiotolerans TaxID=1379870 RepID=A0A0E3V4U8_9BACT|nr:NADH-quinone oxidoreductase subunit L [Spirosoma radiotolerans]AKD53632.1 NADH-quinone oxidoreductase subunit M [Spirosoma radiotolerans]
MPADNPHLLHALMAILLGLPFAGFLVLTAANRRTAGFVAVLSTSIGLALSILLATTLPEQPLLIQADWATFSGVSFGFSLRLDALAALMLVLVHFVALLVQLYSLSYLHDEPKLRRYFAYLQLFVGAMLGIVLAGNLLVMYAFWELVGLASYLLIGFYAERAASSKAAQKAFLMNRVGDIGFLIGIFLTYYQFDTLDFAALATLGGQAVLPTALGLCLFMGCVGKSAQFPLLSWLPDAMEGPTPVSALLHAATMVAAGIFLLARIHPLLSADALVVITIIGTITTLWGGYSALFQTDIKKVLAFSTVSQLGLMVAGMGTDNVSGAMFHLLTHAFFKAGLFLSAGAIIHAVHTQDMRQMGGLRKALPATFIAYTVCAAALSGLPFFSGFLSKEAILGGAFGWATIQGNGFAFVIPVLLLLSSGLTALYMARQWRLIFFGVYRNKEVPLIQAHEPNWLMRGPVLLLALLSVWVWFAANPFSGHGSWFFNLLPTQEEEHFGWLAPVSIGLVLLGSWLGFRMPEPGANTSYVRLSVEYGFLDFFIRILAIRPVLRLAAFLYKTDHRVVDGVVNGAGVTTVVLAHVTTGFDRLGVDGVVNGVAWLAGRLGQLTRAVQNGRVQSYITAAVIGLLVVLWWLL